MYVIWVEGWNGENGYFDYFTDSDYGYRNVHICDSIYDARRFPTETAADSLRAQIQRDTDVRYTEVVRFHGDQHRNYY